MPGFFDRLGKAAQQTAAAAQQAAAEGKLQLDLRQISGRFDDKAAELGKLVYRQQQGTEVTDAEFATLIAAMKVIEEERARKEAELQALHPPTAPAPAAAPAPAPAPTPAPAPASPPLAESEPVAVSSPAAPETPATPEAQVAPAAPVAPTTRTCECGAEVPLKAKFCPVCGRPLAAPAAS